MKKKEKETNKFIDIIARYSIIILFGFFISFFYTIFTPLTMFMLKLLLRDVVISGNVIHKNYFIIEIIPACIGGSAYYLLLALNLLTPMKIKKRIAFIFLSFFLFFLFNILRLFLLISLEINGIKTYFYHQFLWYIGSTVFVFLVWIVCIRIFKVKEIPFVSDFLYLKKLSKQSR